MLSLNISGIVIFAHILKSLLSTPFKVVTYPILPTVDSKITQKVRSLKSGFIGLWNSLRLIVIIFHLRFRTTTRKAPELIYSIVKKPQHACTCILDSRGESIVSGGKILISEISPKYSKVRGYYRIDLIFVSRKRTYSPVVRWDIHLYNVGSTPAPHLRT